MSDIEEWSRWQLHDGKGCPLPVGTVVHVVCFNETVHIGPVGSQCDGDPSGPNSAWLWTNFGCQVYPGYRIRKYRMRQFRALTELRALIADLPLCEPAATLCEVTDA